METTPPRLIIDITEIYELRDRKNRELEYYNRQLQELQHKMQVIRREIDLTYIIIQMVEKEEVVDFSTLKRNPRIL